MRVERRWYTPRSTTSELYVDDAFFCFVLEDRIRKPGVKVPGATCIPAGTYKVIVDLSRRFRRRLPLLVAVPGFSGIRVHPGNTDVDTAGCLLVGEGRVLNRVTDSQNAFDRLFPLVDAAAALKNCSIEVVDVSPPLALLA